jgi:hypothetical protein
MATTITVKNNDEFQEMIDRKDFIISKAIVEAILANLTTRKKHVHVLSVVINDGEEDVEDIYDITLERRYFTETLQENLKYYVERELYEACTQIVNAINTLTEKENGPKSTDTSLKPKTKKKTSGNTLEEKE